MRAGTAVLGDRAIVDGGLGSRREPARMRIVEIRTLSDRVLHLTLAREDGQGVSFEPGQFCSIAIPGSDGDVWRSYSIATPVLAGAVSPICEISVAAVPGGLATDYLFTRQPGDVLRVSGPAGRLVLPSEEPVHYVLVGTGTGMAPYRAMLPELALRSEAQGVGVTLLMGVRTRRERLYGEDFSAFVRGAQGLRRLIVCYSRDSAGPPGSLEFEGYVQEALRRLALTPERDRVYLCGNPDMIDDCTRALVGRGFAKRDLVREKYSTSKPA